MATTTVSGRLLICFELYIIDYNMNICIFVFIMLQCISFSCSLNFYEMIFFFFFLEVFV
jgi:hypothetical protein